MNPIRINGDLPCLFCEDRLFTLVESKSSHEFAIECVRLSSDEDNITLAFFAYSGEATRTNAWTRAEAEFGRLCAHLMADHGEYPTVQDINRCMKADRESYAELAAEHKAETARLTRERDEAVGLAIEASDGLYAGHPMRGRLLALRARIDAAKETL